MDHPIVGAWMVENTYGGDKRRYTMHSYRADGTFTSSFTDGVFLGIWKPTDVHTVELTARHPMHAEDGGFLGWYTIVGRHIHVSDDGQSFTGDGIGTPPGGEAPLVATLVGTRVRIESG